MSEQKKRLGPKEAIELLSRDPGYFIVGFPKHAAHVELGAELNHFAGSLLRPGKLIVEATATRADWQKQQLKLFGEVIVTAPGHYYRCRLVFPDVIRTDSVGTDVEPPDVGGAKKE